MESRLDVTGTRSILSTLDEYRSAVAEIAKRAKGVDLVFGPQTFHRLPDYLARHKLTGRTVVDGTLWLTPADPEAPGVYALDGEVVRGEELFETFSGIVRSRD